MTARPIVSQAEFARLRGVSRKTVTLWKRQERLALTADGKVDVEATEELLAQRPETYRGGRIKAKPTEGQPAVAGEALPLLDRTPEEIASSSNWTLAEAHRVREIYLALLRKQEFETEEGKLVDSLDGKSLGADRCPNSKPWLLPFSAGTREAAMIVKNILLGKGGNVVTIEPTADLGAAVKLLAERRIGAVVILGADHRIVGILSERDIVRALAERGPTALHEPVGQVMTRDVTTCSEDDTIESLMERMTTGKFRHVPAVEQGKLVGIVSIGDVVKNRVEEIEREAAALRDYIQQ